MRSRDLHGWMWSEALSLLEEAERRHRQFFRLTERAAAQADALTSAVPTWEPPVDVIETFEQLHVHVALPGVKVEDVTLMIEPGSLLVSATRAFPASERGARIRRVEIPYGRFERRITLTNTALELTEKHLVHGCLTLVFTKKPESA